MLSMEQLLRITSNPIKYELEIEHARLEYNNVLMPAAQVHTQRQELKIDTENAQMHVDTYEARKSLGLMKTGDQIKMAADSARAALQKKMREYIEDGQAMGAIENGTTIAQIAGQKMLKQPTTVTVFLPSAGAEITWTPHEVKISFDEGKLDYDWDKTRWSMNYIPGEVRMKILQYPSVELEYLGGPMYIPPSADPNYEEKTTG